MQNSRRIILRGLLMIVFLAIAFLSKAQEMWGITTSNYAGSSGALLNPCAINTSKLYMDINIATADFFFENNYAYIHKQDYQLFKFLTKSPEFPKYGPDSVPFDHYTDKTRKYIYSGEVIKGPSFMLAYGRHAIAFHTGARALFSANAIPYDIANFGYYGLDYKEQHNKDFSSKNFGSAGIMMGEVGLTYAYSLVKIGMEDWTAGITVKRLFSVGGGYFRANDLDYIVLNDTTINIKNLNAEVGYSLPLDYDNNEFPDNGPLIKGGGFGIDLGITFQSKVLSYQKKRIRRLCSQRYIDYNYKIGVSLLDVGFVNFSKNAQLQSFNDVSKYWVNIDTLNYYNMNELRRTISDVFYGDPEASSIDDKIRIYLPTAFSLQADYRFTKTWYVGAVWIQPVRLGKSYIRRPAQVALIPRYETRQLEFSVPMSLYDYKYPRMGASVRYHFLTIGSDDLLSLFGMTNFTGLDFYISVKINFGKGFCGRYKHNVPCENEEYGVKRPR
jgi:hypothetical protein